MEIRMRTQISGTTDGRKWPAPGDTIEVSHAVAGDMISSGYAELVEAAQVEAPEKRAAKPVVKEAPVKRVPAKKTARKSKKA